MSTVTARPFNFELDPAHAALVIIDMQRDFVEPGGFGESLGNTVEPLQAIVPAIANVLAAWRAMGGLVVHTRESHAPDLSDCPPAKRLRGSPSLRIGDVGPMGRVLVRGEPGNQIVPELAPVAGTPMDFTQPTAIGTHIKADHPQLKFAEPKQGGFDFNWVLDTKGDVSKVAAEVSDPQSGRHLQLFTSEPGVQFYTSNFLDGTVKGKGGKVYPHWGAFTLETQHYPDAPNQPDFPSTRLDPGQTYNHSVVLKFSAK